MLHQTLFHANHEQESGMAVHKIFVDEVDKVDPIYVPVVPIVLQSLPQFPFLFFDGQIVLPGVIARKPGNWPIKRHTIAEQDSGWTEKMVEYQKTLLNCGHTIYANGLNRGIWMRASIKISKG